MDNNYRQRVNQPVMRYLLAIAVAATCIIAVWLLSIAVVRAIAGFKMLSEMF